MGTVDFRYTSPFCSPAILIGPTAEIEVQVAAGTPATHKWIDASCAGQCVPQPWWWTVSPNGYICVRNTPPQAPDNPYDPSVCGTEPSEPAPVNVYCLDVCSPWAGVK